VDTVVSMQNDNHFFAKTKVDGEKILALLDTGAIANWQSWQRSECFLKKPDAADKEAK